MKPLKFIYLVRHGTTGYNQANLLQGREDHPLNERGIREIQALRTVLADVPIDMVFHSPLKRAEQTASILNESHRAPCHIVDCFSEIDLGDWEGLDYDDVVANNHDFYQKWLADPELKIPGGESVSDVFNRVKPGVDELFSTEGTRILVVGHATVNRTILGNMIGMEPSAARLFRMRNGAYSKLLVFPNPHRRRVVVESWNNTGHLDGI